MRVVDAPSARTGLAGPKAGERAPAQLIAPAACAHVCIWGGGGASGGVLGPVGAALGARREE